MNFRKVNNIAGWAVFAIATLVYILTTEMRGSFWDCGEFVSACYKVQLPHPPGAPLFVMLGRFFIILFGDDPLTAAKAVNVMNALASGFTILFLFWTITHFARKLMTGSIEEPNAQQTLAILGAGAVGGLAYTFSDSFWYSAVEGEVYALSSLFTAIAFWAVLKWERADDAAGNDVQLRNRADRWIVFLFFSLGLSIGIHLLGLLVIPAAVMVYYFKRYNYTRKGAIWAFIIGCAITGLIQVVVIKWTVLLAGYFDVFFKNGIGLPFFTGFAIFFLLLAGLIWYGFRYAARKRYSFLRLGLWCLTFMLLGYSPYITTMERSNANPSLDMNNVDNPMSLVYYLSREQYGSQPILYGQHFLAEQSGEPKEKSNYVKAGDAYQKLTDREPDYVSADKQLFPRMWDNSDKAGAYIDWLNMETITAPDNALAEVYANGIQLTYADQRQQFIEKTADYGLAPSLRPGPVQAGTPLMVRKPNVIDNAQWFMTYQMGFMYWRYFMWNFAGKQNDIQGHGNARDGNWVSGISPLDDMRLGSQDRMPSSIKDNQQNNKLFLLPFILGLIGCIYQFLTNRRDWIAAFLLFFFTGLAIVVYLNQPGSQPRERDYAFAGSFYAYAIWIGLSVVGIVKTAMMAKEDKFWLRLVSYIGGTAFLVLILSDANRTNGSSFIANLGGGLFCAAVAALLILGVRTIASRNFRMGSLVTIGLCLLVPLLMAAQEWDDHDRSKKLLAPDLGRDYLESCPPNAILFTFGDNDTYPLWYAQEVEGVRPDIRIVNTSLLGIDWYANQLRYKVNQSDAFNLLLSADQMRGLNYFFSQQTPNAAPVDLKTFMTTTLSQALSGEQKTGSRIPMPTYLTVPVNAANVKKSGLAAANETVLPSITLDLTGKGVVTLDQLVLMGILASSDWTRPICFTNNYRELGLAKYIRNNGLIYQVSPVENTTPYISMDVAKNQQLLMNNFRFGNANMNGVYFDEENRRNLMFLRQSYARGATVQALSGNKAAARQLLDKAEAGILPQSLPYAMVSRDNIHNIFMIDYLRAAVLADHKELANKINAALVKDLNEQKAYYQYLELNTPQYYDGSLVNDRYYCDQLLEEINKLMAGLNPPPPGSELSPGTTDTNKQPANDTTRRP